MFLFKTKLTTVLGALAIALTLGTAAPAEAAPPEGMRWSDTVWPTHRRPSQPTRVGPAVTSPRFYSYSPVTMTPAVMAPTMTPATVSVRGPDGVVRTYPSSPPAGPVVTYPCR